MKTLIIIPAYNEQDNIENVVSKLQEYAPFADYLIINDCSKDNTEIICKRNNYNYLNIPVNLGIGGGVQAGYKYAYENDYDIVIQHDGDGQHDPKYIKDVIEPIERDEADIVIGSRFINKEGFQSTLLRRSGIIFLSRLIKICTSVKIKDVTSGYRAVNRKYIKIYAEAYAQDYPEPEAIVAAAMRGGRIKEVPVVMHERKGGQSSIHSWKSVYYMIKVSIAIILYRLTFNRKELA